MIKAETKEDKIYIDFIGNGRLNAAEEPSRYKKPLRNGNSDKGDR